MREFSHDKSLNREHDQFLSVTVAVYLGGRLLFLLAVPLILRFESHSRVSRNSGGLSFSSGSSRSVLGSFRQMGKAFSDSLTMGTVVFSPQKDLEALAAHRHKRTVDRLPMHPKHSRNRLTFS